MYSPNCSAGANILECCCHSFSLQSKRGHEVHLGFMVIVVLTVVSRLKYSHWWFWVEQGHCYEVTWELVAQTPSHRILYWALTDRLYRAPSLCQHISECSVCAHNTNYLVRLSISRKNKETLNRLHMKCYKILCQKEKKSWQDSSKLKLGRKSQWALNMRNALWKKDIHDGSSWKIKNESITRELHVQPGQFLDYSPCKF